jgi:hypothetical protein
MGIVSVAVGKTQAIAVPKLGRREVRNRKRGVGRIQKATRWGCAF